MSACDARADRYAGYLAEIRRLVDPLTTLTFDELPAAVRARITALEAARATLQEALGRTLGELLSVDRYALVQACQALSNRWCREPYGGRSLVDVIEEHIRELREVFAAPAGEKPAEPSSGGKLRLNDYGRECYNAGRASGILEGRANTHRTDLANNSEQDKR